MFDLHPNSQSHWIRNLFVSQLLNNFEFKLNVISLPRGWIETMASIPSLLIEMNTTNVF